MTHRPWLVLLAALALLGLAPACGDDDGGTGNDGGVGPDSGPGPDAAPADAGPPGRLTAIWANEGGDKVAQDELRVGQPNGRPVTGSVWDGTTVTLAAARNEVVSFVLVLEAADQTAPGVQVAFDTLTGPGGATIQSQAASGDGVFSWVGRPIELFHVRYLQIKGLSRLGYENYYDERHVPERLRRPWSGEGTADDGTTWADRPDHDARYPDIAVPLELVPSFDVAAGTSQSVWVDVWVPRDATPGLYQGQVTVTEPGAAPVTVPVALTVRSFALPEAPTARTMLYWSGENVNDRYLGQTWIAGGGADAARARLIQDRHALLAHRHRISLIGESSNLQDDEGPEDQPRPSSADRLDGTFFTAANGYEGPGEGVGFDVYSVGTYGGWQGWGDTEANVRQHSDAWVTWFEANAPAVEYFLYLIDESDDYPQIETWSQWLAGNPGPGQRLMSMATIDLPSAVANTPTLRVPTSGAGFGVTDAWEGPAAQYTSDPDRRFYLYNGTRPGAGCFMTEDDGVALRVQGWIQWKKQIDRWFYWESTYYDDFQGGTGKQNLFQVAHTFGSFDETNDVEGETGWNYSNGDGVLFYPGTDVLFPEDSYGVDGPFASLRLKHWRRGLQDHDYLALAAAIDPEAVDAIVQSIVPAVVWEVGVDELADPTYVHADISWSTDPDVWEAARAQLAAIIEGGS